MKPQGWKRGEWDTYPPKHHTPDVDANRCREKAKTLKELVADLEAEKIPDAELEDDGECPCCFAAYKVWLDETKGMSVCDNCGGQYESSYIGLLCPKCGADQ